ncbi:MAG TPA: hypothetical protein VHD37_01950 [Candidatus Paceibacterota bacterium]|nr:hypothetical protein [Candidatus Paceibacterota bacterium]
MIRQTKRAVVFIIALLFLALGVVGLVLPFLQGLLFLAVGFILLFFLFPSLREQTQRRTVKYPKFHAMMLKLEDFIGRILGDI